MSNRWPAGIIRKTPVTPTGPFQNGAASGVWSLADAAYWTKQGLWPLAGNTPPAIEDYFSTYLYTGNGGTQTITNGIDLAGENGMVWIKNRTSSSDPLHYLNFKDGSNISSNNSNNTSAKQVMTPYAAFNSNGFTVNALPGFLNNSGVNYASWTFRKAPKFFDVVTYTGDGANRNIAHNLGVAPGMIIVKRTDTTGAWQVYHRSNANTQYMVLNTTAAVATGATRWNSTTPTATEFTVGTDATVNASGGTYVAYLYAHDTASTGLIQCGTYSANAVVNLGWEPQWLMVKSTDSTSRYQGDWNIFDNMRGLTAGCGNDAVLWANSADSEFSGNGIEVSATGFQGANWETAGNFIYVAIRRGPMKTPTLGTSVFSPVFASGTAPTYTTGFPVDWSIFRAPSSPSNNLVGTRLLQGTGLVTESTTAAFSDTANMFDYNTGWHTGSNTGYISWNFRRAPGFFDTVCFTATDGLLNISHNLGVAPELVIVKTRGTTGNWLTLYSAGAGMVFYLDLDWRANNGFSPVDNFTSNGSTYTAPTANSLFFNNLTSATQVAYLFASCPGVSKVGSYTGNGSSQTINCGFAAGARFVMIKRTDSTGDWFVWDSARGIVAGNDPYLALNSTAAEVTTNDSVDTDNTGFIVNQVAASNVNVNGATYIFLAIS